MALVVAFLLAGWACWRFRRHNPWWHYGAAAGSGVLLALMLLTPGTALPGNRVALGVNVLMLLGNTLVIIKARSGLMLADHQRDRALTDLRIGLLTGASGKALGPGSRERLRQAGVEERGATADLGAAMGHCLAIAALNAGMILASRI